MGLIMRDSILPLVMKGLDAAALRQKITAHNLANINTPGFKRSQVRFEEQVAALLSKADDGSAHMAKRISPSAVERIVPEVVIDNSGSQRQDGNNVDLDAEISQMLMNNILYLALIRQAGDRLEKLRYIINEGRR